MSAAEEKEFIDLYRKGYLPGKTSIKMTKANLDRLRFDKEHNPRDTKGTANKASAGGSGKLHENPPKAKAEPKKT